MIISASRRADIPAHYAQWFVNRAAAGWCAVPNPFNARQVSRISLEPKDVDAVVFWTRDPRPIIAHLPWLDGLGLRSVFQFTLVEYPPALHPGMPALAERLDAFRRLADSIGPERVLWRYDPIVLSAGFDPDYHRNNVEALSKAMEGYTRRMTVSLVEPYRKIRKRLEQADVDLLAPLGSELAGMFTDMAAMARSRGMEPKSCADEAGLSLLGYSPGACVDGELLSRLFGVTLEENKDPHQRPACLCAPSKDIGMYDACPAGCAYCYATQNFERARRNFAAHDPLSESLLGGAPCPTVPGETEG
ncbi:MAG: DUF1848 domain-containing protein [Acidobacteriota bacterium]